MQPQEADHLDAPPPLPPRQLYVNLHIKAENAYSLQCERNQQSNPLLQPFTDTRPETEAQKRLKLLCTFTTFIAVIFLLPKTCIAKVYCFKWHFCLASSQIVIHINVHGILFVTLETFFIGGL